MKRNRSLPLQLDFKNLEELVQRREGRRALLAIQNLRRAFPFDLRVMHVCCNAYRRLGYFKKGLAFIDLKTLSDRPESTKTIEGLRNFWAIRFLSLMGANEYALSLAARVLPQEAEEYRLIGEIFLAQFAHEKAEIYFRQMHELEPNLKAYSTRTSLISLADAWAGQQKFQEAEFLVKEILMHTTEPALQGILWQVIGEYLARAGKTKEALAVLKKAQGFFVEQDQTVDHALQKKWLGYVFCKEGQVSIGTKLLQESLDLMKKLSLRIEAILDVERLRFELGILQPAQWASLCRYPGLPKYFQDQAIHQKVAKKNHGTSTITISLEADEYHWNRQKVLGLPLELKLLAQLWLAGDLGIVEIRLASLLWPNEIYSLFLLNNRIEKLRQRLRKVYRIQVLKKSGLYFLDFSAFPKVFVDFDWPKPNFLRVKQEWNRWDVQVFYRISKSCASKWIQVWQTKGWIRQGRKNSYVTIDSNS